MSTAQSGAWARFCGRDFSPGELERIRALIAQGQVCRSQLARQVCQEFAWLNAQGQLKEMSCKVALLRNTRHLGIPSVTRAADPSSDTLMPSGCASNAAATAAAPDSFETGMLD